MEEDRNVLKLKKQIAEQLDKVSALQSRAETDETRLSVKELYDFGYHFYENGKYPEATHFFTVLTDIDAENSKNWIGLAASLQMQKNYDEAILAYSNAAFLDTNNPEIFFHAANCCFSLDLVSEGIMALDTAEKIAKNKPNCGAMIQQFTTLREMWSNRDEAKSDESEVCSII
ncbi:MAG: tetratricopeptide repeat protein [Parachlamydiaceae bacterium]|nr:tetratricopeptide repeat protein [Parachlamydiaceae bacterium]